VQLFDIRAARILTTVCLFVAIGAFVYGVRHTLVIFLFAILFAYLLEPLVRRVQASPLARGSRRIAIAITYVCVAALLTILGVIFGPRLVADSRELAQSLPGLLDKVANGSIVWQFGNQHGWSFDTQYRIEQLIAAHQAEILSWVSKAGAAAAQFLANSLWLALIPILAIFFLADGGEFARAFIDAFDRRDQRRLLRGIAEDLDQMLAHFIFSQILLAGISLVVYSVMLSVLSVPYALALAVAAGIMEFVPVAGPLVAAAAIVGVGFLTAYPHMWAIFLLLGIWRLCQDYIVSPRVMGGKLELHPMAAIAAVLMGGELGGILGVFLSIPIAATIRVIWKHWKYYTPIYDPAARNKLAEITPRPPDNRVAS
jgi:predicted PurR-regulated permease PerM